MSGERYQKKEGKKKKKIFRKIIITILILLIILAAIGTGMVWNKLSNLEFQKIDTSDLDVNDDLYSQVSSYLTKSEFKAIKNIVLFGVDSTDLDYGRSDTIMIASINPKYDSIKLISIPRDTYVDVSGHGKTKINHAYAYGKEQLSVKTINSNFGLNITEYATIDFSGLINVINDVRRSGIRDNLSRKRLYK